MAIEVQILPSRLLPLYWFTDNFSYEDHLRQDHDRRIPLFVIDAEEHIFPLTSERTLSPENGWKIIGLAINHLTDTDHNGGNRAER